MTCPDCGRAMQRVTVAERRIYACDHCTVAWIPEDGTLVRVPTDGTSKPDAASSPSKAFSPLEEFVEQVVEFLLFRS